MQADKGKKLSVMNFNIDFLTNKFHGMSPLTPRLKQTNTEGLIRSVARFQQKAKAVLIRLAFFRITAARSPKVQKLLFIERMITQRMKVALYQLVHFSLSNKREIIKADKKLNYPIAIIQKVISLRQVKNQEAAIKMLKQMSRISITMESRFNIVGDIVKQYIRKNFYSKFLRVVASYSTKQIEYRAHMSNFQYIFQCARIRILFQSFTNIAIKTTQRNIGALQKQRTIKRDQARVSGNKKIQLINDLKRKVTNMIGQVNEGQINNSRKKVNGSRENGTKLMKLNEDRKGYQTNTSYLEYQLEKIEKQISRKQHFAANRLSNTIAFEHLQSLYSYILSIEDFQKNKNQIYQKLTANSNLEILKENLNFAVIQNIKLQYLMTKYERSIQPKKSDSYVQADSENSSLKALIGSLLQIQYMSDRVSSMVSISNEIQQNVNAFTSEASHLKEQMD